ncbi:MAG TPA: hypothetical protein PKA68_03895 [Arachnia sp.]|nr:hypothetical protein [Arachnia sp.]
MSDAPLLFLDANALASPVTRTLLVAGARADGLRWTWSRHVEVEADRHARGQASQTSIVRKKILGTDLSSTAQGTEGLVTDTARDHPPEGLRHSMGHYRQHPGDRPPIRCRAHEAAVRTAAG